MISTDIEALKNWILEKNKYFQYGFSNAWKDPISGLIAIGETERISIGIDDQYGNYFYIRANEEIRYSEARQQLRDGIISESETSTCYLVAVVRNGSGKELARCLLNSLIRYKEAEIKPVKAIIKREIAVQNELSYLDKKDLQYVLSHLNDMQIVSIEFRMQTLFHSMNDNCPCDPCKKCNDE